MVNGFYDPKWAAAAEAFADNFTHLGEQGAGFSLFHKGEMVVNIWAGQFSNRAAALANVEWGEHTCVNIFSAGKGLVALCVLRLAAQGYLDLSKPIADYWPEFANAGKAAIRICDVLCHRSGLSAFHPHIADDAIFNWELMIQAVAAEEPWWLPNSAQGYSPFMFGWILGELVRRVSGCVSFDAYFQREIAQPLNLSCHFGVADNMLASLADTAPLKRTLPSVNSAVSAGADSVALGKLMKADPRGVTNRAFCNPISLMTAANSREWRQAQIPAANAHANATALAAIYGALAHDGGGLLAPSHLPLCWQEQSFAPDQVLGLPLRFSHGFMLSQATRVDCRYGRGARGFGHPGAGGCLGFADPDYQVGFGYVTNRMGQSLLIDERATQLINAVYGILESK